MQHKHEKYEPIPCFDYAGEERDVTFLPDGTWRFPPLKHTGTLLLPPEGGGVFFIPPVPSSGEGRPVKMLSNYMEKNIGGIRYRVQSCFGREGDFQELSEKLLESRVLKNCAKSAAGD